MLIQRVLTALVLLPLVILAVLYLPTPIFALLLGAIIMLAAWEWGPLCGLGSTDVRLGFLLTCGSGMAALILVPAMVDLWGWLMLAASLWWLAVTLVIARFQPGVRPPAPESIKALIGLFVLWTTWVALVLLHGLDQTGPALVLFCLSISWVADTAAYFAGRAWGKTKLSPHISPKKTREGVYGAFAGVALWSGLLIWLRPETGPAWAVLLFCLLVCLVSVVGDLFESLLKREAGIKDSGNILPGHGGILDRIDSLTAVAPVFACGVLLLGGGL